MARAPKSEDDVVEPDRFEGFPHPRETGDLFGHEAAERQLLDAYRSGRMHHGWLMQGSEGIGKATLGYRLASFILTHPDPAAADVAAATRLSIAKSHPAARQVVAQSHPDLHILRRGLHPRTKTVQMVISVDAVREALHFFSMTAAAGGWRILIVDTADDLNINAANALLKTLEEPPARCLMLLIASNPGRLLSTIRSRCRRLALQPLQADELQHAIVQAGGGEALVALDEARREQMIALAAGSVRRALTLLDATTLDLYREVATLVAQAVTLDQAHMHGLIARMVRPGKADQSALLLEIVEHTLARHVQTLAGRTDGRTLARLAEVWEKTRRLAAQTDVYHFDRKQVILNVFRWIEAASR